ncbi:MAG: class I SAM-dependent methyltransferase [Scytonema sp. RU_4_4]|nr:class I SAM-dependent methyltransferase [Scytonema sp. RU_4_4]
MELNELQKHWHEFGKEDPFWSILSDPAKKGNKWELKEFFKSGEEEIEAVFKYLESLGVSYSHKRALDFGCGVGRLTQGLCRYFDECIGVDIAPSMIKLANKYNYYGHKCKYYINDSDNLSLYKNNYFDFIYSRIVLQHIIPKYSMNYLKEFVRILAPSGLLVFQVPSEVAPCESLEDSAYNAEITTQQPLIKAKAGFTTTIKVNVKNISNVTWPSFAESNEKHYINLGNHWLNESGEIIVNDDGREPLLKSLQPLEDAEFLLTITVPKEIGNYILELDMVHEGVAWFKDKGSPTLKIPVKVEEVIQRNGISRISHVIFNSYYKLINSKQKRANFQHFVPRMEIHSIPKDVVLKLIDDSGGKVVDVQQDFSAGKWWISYRYIITK